MDLYVREMKGVMKLVLYRHNYDGVVSKNMCCTCYGQWVAFQNRISTGIQTCKFHGRSAVGEGERRHVERKDLL